MEEAIVLAFTMGSTGDKVTREHAEIFKYALTTLYPKKYDIGPQHLFVFDLAFEEGKKFNRETGIDLSTFDFQPFLDRPISEVRDEIGLDMKSLIVMYNLANAHVGDERASRRITRHWPGVYRAMQKLAPLS